MARSGWGGGVPREPWTQLGQRALDRAGLRHSGGGRAQVAERPQEGLLDERRGRGRGRVRTLPHAPTPLPYQERGLEAQDAFFPHLGHLFAALSGRILRASIVASGARHPPRQLVHLEPACPSPFCAGGGSRERRKQAFLRESANLTPLPDCCKHDTRGGVQWAKSSSSQAPPHRTHSPHCRSLSWFPPAPGDTGS